MDNTNDYVKSLVVRRREELQKEIEAINELLKQEFRGGRVSVRVVGPSNDEAAPTIKKKRVMSAAARKSISDAQKARWAKMKAGNKKAPKASRSGAQRQ